MLNRRLVTACAGRAHCLLAAMLLPAVIQAAQPAVGPTLGTRGVGIELAYPVRENLNLRATIAGFEYGKDVEEAGIDYEGDMKLGTGGVILDWYPSSSSLRLSLGVLYNGNRLKARAATGDSGIEIGSNTYDIANETLSGTIKWNAAAPFLGIGWGRPNDHPGWHFGFEIGAIYSGKPSADLSASSGLRAQPGFEADLAAEEEELNRQIKKASFWPVVQLQVQYRF